MSAVDPQHEQPLSSNHPPRRWSSGGIIRTLREGREPHITPSSELAANTLDRLQTERFNILDRYADARAAARADALRDDLSTLDNRGLLTLAQEYASAITPEQRDQLAVDIADKVTVDEAGVILRAAAAIRTAVPRIVLRAKANGDTTAEIARELDMTDSYLRRIAREHRQVSWRIDLYDGEAGPGWQPYEEGVDIIPTTRTEPNLAEHILAAAGRGPREHRARVLIWSGTDEQPDNAAIYTQECDPQADPLDTFVAGLENCEEAPLPPGAQAAALRMIPRRWQLDRQWDADGRPAGDWYTVDGGGEVIGAALTDAGLAARFLERERRTQPPEARLRLTVWRDSDTPGPDATVVYSEPHTEPK